MFFLMTALFIFSAAFAQETKTLILKQERATLQQPIPNDKPSVAPKAGTTVWTEGFESSTFPPTGWANQNTPFYWYADYGHTGPASIGYGSGSSSFPTYGIVTPAINATAATTLSFWAMHGYTYNPSSSYYTAYRIRVSTTTQTGTFTTIKEYSNYAYSGINSNNVIYTPSQIAGWYEMTADLGAYAGQQIYVAIQVYDHYGDDDITIDDVSILYKKTNDLRINPIAFPYTKVPLSQGALLSVPMTATATNIGTAVQTNVVNSITRNGAPIGTSNTIASLNAGATSAAMTLNTPAGTFPATPGNNNLTYTVSSTTGDEDMSDNSATYPFEMTQNLYAVDEVTDLNSYGVGYTTANALIGNFFTISQPTSIDKVTLAFGLSNQGLAYNVRLYTRTGTTIAANPIFSQPATIVSAAWETVDVPDMLLLPGDYFLCVQQSSATNPGLLYDGVSGRYCYGLTTGTALTQQTGFGSLGLRMVTKDLSNIDMAAVSIAGNLTPMALTPINYNVTVQNFGLLPANNYTIKLMTGDGEVLGTETITTPLASAATYVQPFSVTFPQEWAGALTLKAVVTITGDQDLANNETTLALNIAPHPGYIVNCIDATITPGTVSNTNYTLPSNNLYNHSYTQQIYDAAEIGLPAGSVISYISFLPTHTSSGTYTKINQSVYLANIPTTKTTFTSATDYIATNLLEQVVAPRTITFNHSSNPQWHTIDFDQPFVYDGGNIAVIYVNNHTTYSSQWCYRTGSTTGYKSTGAYSDTYIYDVGSLGGSSSYYTYRMHAKFGSCQNQYTLHPLNILDPKVTLTPDPVPHGQTAVVNFYPEDDCHYITGVLMDGTSIGNVTSYNFGGAPITEVLPYFDVQTTPFQYTITTSVNSAGNFGTITPTAPYDCGTDVVITMTPDPGYKVSQIIVDGVPVTNPLNKYTFHNLLENHTIEVTFMECPFKIYLEVVGDGSVYQIFTNGDSNEVFPPYVGVDYGMSHFTFVPDAYNTLKTVNIDNVYNAMATLTGSYVFPNVTSNHSMKVVFEKEKYTIVATAGANGTITPSGNVSVSYGDNKEFTLTPNQGYVIDQVLVDGNNNTTAIAAGSYTFENIAASHTIYVSFKKATMYITSNASGCGNVYPEGEIPVLYNGTQIFTFAPTVGCKVSMVYVDGMPYPNAIPTGSYTFYYVTGPHTLFVEFEKITYPVTAKITDHGVLNNVGTTMIEHGESMTYNFYAMPGYEIANVFVDGYNNMAAIAAGTYTFSNVTAPHTIDVRIAPQVYTINATAGVGGYITPMGDIPVTYQGNQAFTFAALPGYEIEEVLVDNIVNVAAAVSGAYAFTNVNDNHTISVSFKMSRFQIKSSVGEGGGIAPYGITEITYFDNITYTITPNQDYKISYVMVNGENMGAIETFTFSDVLKDGAIEAFFFYSPVGIGEQPLEGLSIYTHTNVVYIVNENNLPLNDVTIFDMYGRVVWQGIPQGHSITLNVANGIYTVRVTSEDNATLTKVPIQR